MTTADALREIYQTYKTVAVYGMSTNPEKPAHYVPVFLDAKGYEVIPVNPRANQIMGRQSYANLQDIPTQIDIVDVFRPAEEAVEVVKEAIARRQAKGDVAVIWLQKGLQNEAARQLAEAAGITFVQNYCMKEEFKRLFPEKG